MKKKIFVAIWILFAAFIMKAQDANNIKRNVIINLDEECHVSDNEFVYNYRDVKSKRLYKKDFLAILRNDDNDIIGFLHNEGVVKLSAGNDVRKIKVGYSNDFIVVNKLQTSMELNINNCIIKHDTIVDLFENGYIYGVSGAFYYRKYCSDTLNEGVMVYHVPQKSVLNDDKEIPVKFSERPFDIHLDKGHEIFVSTEEHYYFIYQTSLMEHAVVIVDGNGYVLDGNCKNLRFKYSANYNNWIICCDDYLLVNGVKFSIKDKTIRDFFINDHGEFACILDYITDDENTSDLYINGKLHLRNMKIFALQLMDVTEWIYRYEKREKFYEGNGYVYKDYTNKTFYFDYNDVWKYNEDVLMKSDDGKHVFSYKSEDDGSVVIDGKKIKTNRPYSVFWNNSKQAFVWTTYENNALYLNMYNITK